MKVKLVVMCIALLILSASPVFAGLEWQATSVSKTGGETDTTITHAYAQAGNVREEFVKAAKGAKGFEEKGNWWLYRGDSNTVYIVDPEEKTYTALNLDSILQFTGVMNQLIQMKITNLKVEVTELPDEVVAGYQCKHIMITTSYDMEMKVMIMKVKQHSEQTREIWGTKDIALKDMAMAFNRKAFHTGMAGLDTLIQIQMEPYKEIGLFLKSLTTDKTMDQKGKESIRTRTTTMSDLSTKPLSDQLFKIPDDYKRVSLTPPGLKQDED